MLVLGIESTCDETACALVRDGRVILSHRIASQAELHSRYGGVFPELAGRHHCEAMLPLVDATLREAGLSPDAIDLIAVAYGPGLMGSLVVGLNCAKALAWSWGKPWIGVNHVEAHLYAAMMGEATPLFPGLGVVISGGHTFLTSIDAIGHYRLLGTTVDDAMGEAFDKVASLLGLPYPGGPALEKLARQGDPTRVALKAGKVKGKPYHFSFSGLKTNVLYTIKGQDLKAPRPLSDQERADIAASFQETAFRDLRDKVRLALREGDYRALYVGGGVSCNQRLRALFEEEGKMPPLFWPPKELSLDNAAMIAGLGFHLFQQRGAADPLDLEPQTRYFGGRVAKKAICSLSLSRTGP